MTRIGYIYLSMDDSYTNEQIKAIQNLGITQIFFSEADISIFHPGDELVIYELKSLAKTVTQVAAFMELLNKKKIQLTVLKKESFMELISNLQFQTILFDLAEVDRFAISERTSKGIKSAKQNGRIGGRPRISKQKIEHIRHLYHNLGYTYREIADTCEVSLGTAYKYVISTE